MSYYHYGYVDPRDPRNQQQPVYNQHIEVQIPPRIHQQSAGLANQAAFDTNYAHPYAPIPHEPRPQAIYHGENSQGNPFNGYNPSIGGSGAIQSHVAQWPEPQPESEADALDYSLLLIDLAEDYFEAALGTSSESGIAQREPDHDEFCKLIATGLACLQVALRVPTCLTTQVEP